MFNFQAWAYSRQNFRSSYSGQRGIASVYIQRTDRNSTTTIPTTFLEEELCELRHAPPPQYREVCAQRSNYKLFPQLPLPGCGSWSPGRLMTKVQQMLTGSAGYGSMEFPIGQRGFNTQGNAKTTL